MSLVVFKAKLAFWLCHSRLSFVSLELQWLWRWLQLSHSEDNKVYAGQFVFLGYKGSFMCAVTKEAPIAALKNANWNTSSRLIRGTEERVEIYIEQLHLLHLPLLVMDLHSLLSIECNIWVSSSFLISVPSRPGRGPSSSLVFRWLKELSMVSYTIA